MKLMKTNDKTEKNAHTFSKMLRIACAALALTVVFGSFAGCSSTAPAPVIPDETATVVDTTSHIEETTLDPTEASSEATMADETEAVTEDPTETEEATEPTERTATKETDAPKPTEPKATESPKPAHTHSYTTKVVAPTCTTQGYTKHTCSCGDSYTDTTVAATGHNYSKTTVVAPTCTDKGYTKRTCSCGAATKDNYVEATGHNYSQEKTVAPTCEKKGYTKHTCANCGDVTKDNYVEATGHSYTTETVAATTESKGYDKHTCSKCGDVYKDNYTEKVKVEDKLDLEAAMAAGNAYALQIGFGSIDYSLTMDNAGYYPYAIIPSHVFTKAVQSWGYSTRQEYLVSYVYRKVESTKEQLEGSYEVNGHYDNTIADQYVRTYIYYDAGQDSYIIVVLYK